MSIMRVIFFIYTMILIAQMKYDQTITLSDAAINAIQTEWNYNHCALAVRYSSCYTYLWKAPKAPCDERHLSRLYIPSKAEWYLASQIPYPQVLHHMSFHTWHQKILLKRDVSTLLNNISKEPSSKCRSPLLWKHDWYEGEQVFTRIEVGSPHAMQRYIQIG